MSISAPDTEENGKIDEQLSMNKKKPLFEHETTTYHRQKLAMEIARTLYEKPTYRSRKNITEILRSLKEKRKE